MDEKNNFLSCHHPVSIVIRFKKEKCMLRTHALSHFFQNYLQILEIFIYRFPWFSRFHHDHHTNLTTQFAKVKSFTQDFPSEDQKPNPDLLRPNNIKKK